MNAPIAHFPFVSFPTPSAKKVAPLVEQFSFPKNLTRGKRLRAVCTVTEGDRPIDLQWRKDGAPILMAHANGGALTVRRIDEFTSLLAVSFLETSHAGNYSCVASNQVATFARSAVLTIRGEYREKLMGISGMSLPHCSAGEIAHPFQFKMCVRSRGPRHAYSQRGSLPPTKLQSCSAQYVVCFNKAHPRRPVAQPPKEEEGEKLSWKLASPPPPSTFALGLSLSPSLIPPSMPPPNERHRRRRKGRGEANKTEETGEGKDSFPPFKPLSLSLSPSSS